MKTITETISKISDSDIKDLTHSLKIKSKSEKSISSALQNINGLNNLLSTLNVEEIKFLKLVYSFKDGITFGQIEKELKFGIPRIESISKNLSKKLLAYTIKNRQLLNNKMDKVYAIKEVSTNLNIIDKEDFINQLIKIDKYSNLKDDKKTSPTKIKDKNSKEILKFIMKSGFITTIDELSKKFSKQIVDDGINYLYSNNIVSINHLITDEFNICILINKNQIKNIITIFDDLDIPSSISCHNKYSFILNLLYCFDSISSFGLFLTKQNQFRKIDKKRINESLMPIENIDGKEFSHDTISKICLHALYKLDCLEMQKDIAIISLLEIKKDLLYPEKILYKFIQKIDENKNESNFFSPPFQIPTLKLISYILQYLAKKNTTSYSHLLLTILTLKYTDGSIKDVLNPTHRNHKIEEVANAVKFMLIIGCLEIKNGNINISDVGIEVTNLLLKLHLKTDEKHTKKILYINPDFSLMIPTQEIDSKSLYHLLTHSEIIKNDVILHAIINKSTIVKAHKREMILDQFIETLKKFSKNELPQNLNFLLSEWTKQTINIEISNSILLKTSHPSFIDEISFSKTTQAGIVERISQNHIIVSKDHIDEIIKLAKKKDAVITIFTKHE